MRTNEFVNYLKSKAFTNRSIKSRTTVIRLFWKWLDKEHLEAEQISYNDLLLYMKYRNRKGASQRTIQSYMGTIRHFYDYLIREGKVATNPAAEIEVKGVKRKVLYHILEPHELHQLYNQYPDKTPRDRRNKVILGLLVYQGLRTEEVSRLAVQDIQLREGKIDVLGSRKNNGRLMQLESAQVMDMYDYILQVRPELLKMNPKRKYQSSTETDRLFINEGGSFEHFSNMITQLMIKARKINPSVKNAKQIRASVITKWLRQHNLREAQYLAGHRYISSTESFLQNEMEGLKEEVQQFHPLG
jgi:integrase/recombinase XerD